MTRGLCGASSHRIFLEASAKKLSEAVHGNETKHSRRPEQCRNTTEDKFCVFFSSFVIGYQRLGEKEGSRREEQSTNLMGQKKEKEGRGQAAPEDKKIPQSRSVPSWRGTIYKYSTILAAVGGLLARASSAFFDEFCASADRAWLSCGLATLPEPKLDLTPS